MSNDIVINDSTVVAIQGVAVSDEAPTDGYVLTYVDGYSEWQPKPIPAGMTGLRKDYFTSNGSWTCPAGVTNVLIIAASGGSGGFGGGISGGQLPSGGRRAIEVIQYLSVTPGVSYTVVIGSGGSGGTGDYATQPDNNTPRTFIPGSVPTLGSSTQFKNGSNILLSTVTPSLYSGLPIYTNTYSDGSKGTDAYSGLTMGTGGLGGESGPRGNGGNGGNGAVSSGGSSATGSNGSNATNNTGAGGGNGGFSGNNGTPYTSTGGNGGNGSSGYLYIIY